MNKRSGTKTKKKIIDAAMDVFSRKGFARANIREIAKAAGISIGSVYLYFRNKEELYKNLINVRMRYIDSKLRIAAKRSESATEALSNFFKLHLENALKHKEFILLHIREHGFTFGVHEKRKFFRKQGILIENIIQRGIQSGEFRKCNPKDMSKIIIGSLRGIVLSIALDEDVHISPKMLNEFIFKGLLTSKKEEELHIQRSS